MQLETSFRDVLARLDNTVTAKPSLLSKLTGASPAAQSTPSNASLETVLKRIETMRDEIAADIAASEHEIWQAFEVTKDRR